MALVIVDSTAGNQFADDGLLRHNSRLGSNAVMVGMTAAGGTDLFVINLNNPVFAAPAAGGGGRQISIDTSGGLTTTGIANGTVSIVELRTAVGGDAVYRWDDPQVGGGDVSFNTLEISIGLAVECNGGTVTAPTVS